MSRPVEIEILGSGSFHGARANVIDYSVEEYASPLDLSSMQSGVGGISFSVNEDPGPDGSVLLSGQPFILTDPFAGIARGVIDSAIASDDMSLSVDGATSLLPLVAQRSLPATSGTLGATILSYFASCGMDGTSFQIDPAINTIPVNLPAWTGEVWAQIKKLQAIHQFEMADIGGTIVIRALRKRMVDTQRYTRKRVNRSRDGAYQTVEVVYYNNKWKANALVYPPKDVELNKRSIISIDAGQTTTDNVPVNMWISSISQPTQALHLEDDPQGIASSTYAVVDKDGAPVTVADWRNGGGEVSFAIGADGKSVDITVRGMTTNARAPYRIASSSADREYQYAALYIVATGVAFDPKTIWAPTSASLEDAPADSVLTIDDPMVSTHAEAISVRANAILEHTGVRQRLEASTTRINRRGEVGAAILPSFADWAEAHATQTFGQFDAEWGNKTFLQFDQAQADLVAQDFASQAFGGMGGARVKDDGAMYRISVASGGPGLFSWTADLDTTFADWEDEHLGLGLTFSQFDSAWGNKTFEQHARTALVTP